MPGSDVRPLPELDLDHVVEHTRGLWEELRGARVFVTGGSGFFGRWMIESLLAADRSLGLNAQVILLTRSPQRLVRDAPHVAASRAVTLLAGDVRSFACPDQRFSHVLHMATETDLGASATASFDTAVEGTRRVLQSAAKCGARKLLLTSSGAVYGPQPPDCERLSEECSCGPFPQDPSAGYAHGKRAAEFLCCAAAAESGLDVKIARCFAFVGPLLPLDAQFAVGNFIRDALCGQAIEVKGDGTPRRSYLYAADLAVWLWTILLRGESARPYNVGSAADIGIADLAHLVAGLVEPSIPVHVVRTAEANAVPERYVPDASRAESELGLRTRIQLPDAVQRTARWHEAGYPR